MVALVALLLIAVVQDASSRLLVGLPSATDSDSSLRRASNVAETTARASPSHSPALPARDTLQVRHLPDAPDHDGPMYAGLMPVWEPQLRNDGSLFFWLFKHRKNDAPLLVWLNGGPGCSSMEGALLENGPLVCQHSALAHNPHSWDKDASVLYIDQPIGTGLSTAPSGRLARNQTHINIMFAAFLRHFLKVFPEYSGSSLWLSGESYAGVYIPNFALHLLQGTDGFHGLSSQLQLRGIMIGNGWIHPLIQTQTMPEYAYSMGLLNWQQRHYLETSAKNCGRAHRRDQLVNPDPLIRHHREGQSQPVHHSPAQLYREEHERAERRYDHRVVLEHERQRRQRHAVTSRIGGAPLSVPECNNILSDLLLSSGSATTGLVNIYDVRLYDHHAGLEWPGGQFCVERYLNRADVREALHVAHNAEWHECNMEVNGQLAHENMVASRPLLITLMDRWHLPVLLYNGQFDLICNHAGMEAFLNTMMSWKGYEAFVSANRAIWRVDGEIAGYVTTGQQLTIAVVLGGSHMCPIDKPTQTLDMVRRFMTGRSLEDEKTAALLDFTPTTPFIPGDAIPPHHDSATRATTAGAKAMHLSVSEAEGETMAETDGQRDPPAHHNRLTSSTSSTLGGGRDDETVSPETRTSVNNQTWRVLCFGVLLWLVLGLAVAIVSRFCTQRVQREYRPLPDAV
jgi:carboxypeptidase D